VGVLAQRAKSKEQKAKSKAEKQTQKSESRKARLGELACFFLRMCI